MKYAKKLMTTAILSLGCLAMTSEASAEGFPNAISFSWQQPTANFLATGPLSGYAGSSSFRPYYNVQFKAGNDVRSGILTLTWSWPSHVDFTFYNNKTGATCPGAANLQGTQFVGSMTCQGGTYPVAIR